MCGEQLEPIDEKLLSKYFKSPKAIEGILSVFKHERDAFNRIVTAKDILKIRDITSKGWNRGV